MYKSKNETRITSLPSKCSRRQGTTKHLFLSLLKSSCSHEKNKRIQDGRNEKQAVSWRYSLVFDKPISSQFLSISFLFSIAFIIFLSFFFFPLFLFITVFFFLFFFPPQYFLYHHFFFSVHHQKFLRLFPPFSYGLIGCRKPLHAIRVWMTNVFQILASAEFSEAGPRTDVRCCEGDRKPIMWTKCQTTWERWWLDIRRERRKCAGKETGEECCNPLMRTGAICEQCKRDSYRQANLSERKLHRYSILQRARVSLSAQFYEEKNYGERKEEKEKRKSTSA